MKFKKSLLGVILIIAVAVLTFEITYEVVSANETIKAIEKQKKEVVFKSFITHNEENNINLDKNKDDDKDDLDKMKNFINTKTNNFIFIGDTRLDSLKDVSYSFKFDFLKFITSDNFDCDWVRNKALFELNNILNNTSLSYNIVFSIGINDLENVDRYITFFNDMAKLHPNHNIFVIDISPLDEIKFLEYYDGLINNDDIYSFNRKLTKGLDPDVKLIYSYKELIINGYNTIDGYYFDEDTSLNLMKFIKEYISSFKIKK